MKRSYQAELLDSPDIPKLDLFINLQELDTINKWLGGHQLNIQALKKTLKFFKTEKTLQILEIASGGGDNLRVLATWCRKNSIKAKFIGVDLKADCIEYSEKRSQEYSEITFVCSDYLNFKPTNAIDIAFSSLFCHHLNEEELNQYIDWNQRYSKYFFINDLHRHQLAKTSIAVLTKLFSNSYLVKNDAPLSVNRAFIKHDWIRLFERNKAEIVSLQWKWAFRWMLLGKGKADV